MPGRRRLIFGFVIALIVAYIVFRRYAVAYVRYLWFHNLGFTTIFWRVVTARAETGLVGGVAFGLFVYVQLRLTAPALRALPADAVPSPYAGWLRTRRLNRALAWSAAGIGALAALILSSQWSTVWFFAKAVPFGTRDPIFHRDVADYVFRLPFWRLLYQGTGVAFWVGGLAALTIYFSTGWFNVVEGRLLVHPHARSHLYGVLAGYLALKGIGYRLAAWNLMYTKHGFVSGVSYSDIHAALPALRILMVGAWVAAALAVWGATGRRGVAVWGVAGLVACSLLVGTIFPALVERIIVTPSQLQRESPYIANNIAATRTAFGLDSITLQNFPVSTGLTAADLKTFQPTFRNIRLWDWRIASPAFQQLQGLRTYYSFDPLSIGRYTVQGAYRQVLLSARELNYSSLPSETWQNRHLKYTHGYGAVVVPAAGIGDQGMPSWWMQDIGNTSTVGLALTQPRIYYGLAAAPYAIVGPNLLEFDHPQGQQDVYNHYTGSGGIPVAGFFHKLDFAIWANNYNILFTEGVGPGAKALIYRNVQQRVQQLLGAPFLIYDSTPYLVIAGGRLYWIIDAYTTSTMYPYATPAPSGINYIRNSVKVVVDAYNGSVQFYVADPSDPIIQTEERIFPGVFKPLSSMPSDLRIHIRYPQDMFSVQAQMYATYHMTDPTVFYDNEDPWVLAKEQVGNLGASGQGQTPTAVPPYYVMLQFPNVQGPQFVLMQPFTPLGNGRDNMAAWMAAFSDGANYGKLVAYEFPKEQTVFGPLQVESQINQDPTVAQDLALWSRGGSQVARGNLLVIPVRNSILYVEPLYVTATSTNLPALRRVIVDYGGQQIASGDTLDSALASIFGPLPWNPATQQQPSTTPSGPTAPSAPSTPSGPTQTQPSSATRAAQLTSLAQQAQQVYGQAQADLKNGNFTGYAQQIQALGSVLAQMVPAPSGTSSGGASGTGTPAASSATGGSG